jgi:hypothetical protein
MILLIRFCVYGYLEQAVSMNEYFSGEIST